MGLHQHLLTLTTRTGEQYVIDPKPYCAFFSPSLRFCYKVNNANFTCSSEILKLALSLLSCSLIDLTLLVEVTCQHGRYISEPSPRSPHLRFPVLTFLCSLESVLKLYALQPIAALPYLDREFSPSMYRSFFIPYLWQEKNVFGMYKLFKRVSK